MELRNLVWGWTITALLILDHGSCQRICIVGAGIGGSSIAHFIRKYSEDQTMEIHIFERNSKVGGRMAMIELAGDKFEAGGTILQEKNLHTLQYSELLGLKRRAGSDDSDFGIWDGDRFIFRTLQPGKSHFAKKITSLINSLSLLWRYGISLFRMQNFVACLCCCLGVRGPVGCSGLSKVVDVLDFKCSKHPVGDSGLPKVIRLFCDQANKKVLLRPSSHQADVWSSLPSWADWVSVLSSVFPRGSLNLRGMVILCARQDRKVPVVLIY